jgi:hypothetical protein
MVRFDAPTAQSPAHPTTPDTPTQGKPQRPTAADFFNPTSSSTSSLYDCALPPSVLQPRFPTGPLNVNPDGTPINYRKSHCGPNADYWQRADAEEFQRLFQTGTLRPILYTDIPADNVVTYVNPVCSEKVNDDG